MGTLLTTKETYNFCDMTEAVSSWFSPMKMVSLIWIYCKITKKYHLKIQDRMQRLVIPNIQLSVFTLMRLVWSSRTRDDKTGLSALFQLIIMMIWKMLFQIQILVIIVSLQSLLLNLLKNTPMIGYPWWARCTEFDEFVQFKLAVDEGIVSNLFELAWPVFQRIDRSCDLPDVFCDQTVLDFIRIDLMFLGKFLVPSPLCEKFLCFLAIDLRLAG